MALDEDFLLHKKNVNNFLLIKAAATRMYSFLSNLIFFDWKYRNVAIDYDLLLYIASI